MSAHKLYIPISIAIISGGSFLLWRSLQWHPLVSFFLAMNIWTLLIYGWDKAISPTRITRVPENVLHLLALCGGSPAALIGQKLFRHKTQKNSFLLIYALIVLLQIGLITYLFMVDKISF